LARRLFPQQTFACARVTGMRRRPPARCAIRLQGSVYALLTGRTTGRDVSRIEFVFAAPGETRTITDIDGIVAEVQSLLASQEAEIAP
jgi:hypothetical protein